MQAAVLVGRVARSRILSCKAMLTSLEPITMGRISKERMDKALEQLKTISAEDYAKVKALAGIVKPLRSVLRKTPDQRRLQRARV